MGPDGFGVTSLWLVFFDAENRVLPAIVPIDDLPTEPDRDFLHGLLRIVADLIDSGNTSSVAMLLSRPGPAAINATDRRWARALRAELGDRLTTWPIHLATHGRVRVFAPDDLVS